MKWIAMTLITDCDVMFQMKRHSWEMKYFVPKENPEVPLLMSAVEQQLSAGNGIISDDDDELDEMCNGLLDDEHAQLSPLAVIDKSALVDDTIVGMSHDIDDVVDSVINHDDLPPLADLSELTVLPPATVPTKHATSTDTALHSVEKRVMPKLSLNVPGLTCVNSEPAVFVRLRRLNSRPYRSPDIRQRIDTSASSHCVQSLNVTPESETACKSIESSSFILDRTVNADYVFVKQEPTVLTSEQLQNSSFVSKLHDSVSVKRCSSSEKSLKSSMKKSGAHTSTDDSRHSREVVVTDVPVDAARSTGSKVKSRRPVCASVKHKSDTVSDVHSVKKLRTGAVPTANNNKLPYVICDIAVI